MLDTSTMRAGNAPAPAARIKRYRPSFGRCMLLSSAALVLAFILLPLVFVIWMSVFRQEIPTFPPDGYSLRWFKAVFGQDVFVQGLLLSLQVTAMATLLAMALGTAAALALVRTKMPFKGFFNNLLLTPMVLPGVVLGAAIYVAQIEVEMLTQWPLLGSFWGLALAHALVVLPWGSYLRRRHEERGASVVLAWGGLHGALSLALALSIPEGPYRSTLLVVTYAVAAFSTAVQGLSFTPVAMAVRRRGLAKAAPDA